MNSIASRADGSQNSKAMRNMMCQLRVTARVYISHMTALYTVCSKTKLEMAWGWGWVGPSY